jgi:branched-chain amino acid transport system substrate-binding protein
MTRMILGASPQKLAMTLAMVIVIGSLAAQTTFGEKEKRYAPGVSDTEIKIGQTMPYSGPASAYAAVGKAEAAYLKMINEKGGINGRRINLISLDDGYSPPKTVEQTRKLVEQDGVAFIWQSLGTPTNTATQRYLNEHKIPQLFISSFASKFNDPTHFPWTMGGLGSYYTEGEIYAQYIMQHYPQGRIAVLYQNDDYGKDYVKGLTDGLGGKAAQMIVQEVSYEVTDATVDSQIVALQASGADIFYDVSGPKFAAQAIRRAYEIGWRPVHFLNTVSSSVSAVLKPAGLEKSTGIISVIALKDPTDARWHDDPGYRDWLAWLKKYYPDGDVADLNIVYGYTQAQMLVHVLRACGDDLSRENIMAQAANLHHLTLPMLLPGITLNTSLTDYQPLKQLRMARFDGQTWQPFGDVVEAKATK